MAAVTAAAIAEAGWTDRVIVSSFQASTLRAVQAADGRLPLGVLWPFLTDIEAGLARAVAEGWSAVHPFVTEARPELVKRAQAAGLAVNVWTVNARHDLAALVAAGRGRRHHRPVWPKRCPSPAARATRTTRATRRRRGRGHGEE